VVGRCYKIILKIVSNLRLPAYNRNCINKVWIHVCDPLPDLAVVADVAGGGGDGRPGVNVLNQIRRQNLIVPNTDFKTNIFVGQVDVKRTCARSS
jgi:hypothetical protein